MLEFWRNERVEVTPLYNPLSLPSARSSSFRARARAAAPRVPVCLSYVAMHTRPLAATAANGMEWRPCSGIAWSSAVDELLASLVQYSRSSAAEGCDLPEIVEVILLSPEPTPFRPRKHVKKKHDKKWNVNLDDAIAAITWTDIEET